MHLVIQTEWRVVRMSDLFACFQSKRPTFNPRPEIQRPLLRLGIFFLRRNCDFLLIRSAKIKGKLSSGSPSFLRQVSDRSLVSLISSRSQRIRNNRSPSSSSPPFIGGKMMIPLLLLFHGKWRKLLTGRTVTYFT